MSRSPSVLCWSGKYNGKMWNEEDWQSWNQERRLLAGLENVVVLFLCLNEAEYVLL